MVAINRLNQVEKLVDNDIIPIWDVANGRTRSALASTFKSYIQSATGTAGVVSGTYDNGMLTLTMSDGSDVTITGWVGFSSDTHQSDAIYSYDPVSNKWIDTGVTAKNGSIQTAAGSVGVGNHLISSAGQNFAFTNRRTGVTYVPPWQELSESGNDAPVRVNFTTDLKTIVRNADTSTTLTNPRWSITNQQADEVVFRVALAEVVSPQTNVYIIGHVSGQDEFRVELGDLSAGQQEIKLLHPVFVKNLDAITLSLWSPDGDVVVKGSAAGVPAYSAIIREYTEISDGGDLSVKQTDGQGRVDLVTIIKTKGMNVTAGDNAGEVVIEPIIPQTPIGAHFVGIYDDLQALQDAIAVPANNYQAIVISPSEKYYHGVGGSWVELAPVGNIHPSYLGAYDTVQDLQTAHPSPSDEDLAIVGTTDKSFYIYQGASWVAIKGTDLPALTGRVDQLETKMTTAESDIQGLKASDQVLQSNIDQKLSGMHIEDADGNAFDDITSLFFDGATATLDSPGIPDAKITVKPKITVANGQEPGSTSLTGNAIIFPGATITADPNDANVLTVGRTDTPRFDPSIFQSAVDHGYAADDQGVKSSHTADGWWIFKDLKSVGGRPTDSVGDLVVFKNTITSTDPALMHAFVMAMGKDKDGTNRMWMMYRDGTSWGPWFSVGDDYQTQVDDLVASVAQLKSADAATVQKIDALNTKIGSLYAPDKAAFDTEVNALIQEALKDYVPKHGGQGGGGVPEAVYPRFYAQFSNQVPTSFASATTSTNSEATLIRIPTTPSRVFISVENDNNEASKVKGFKFNNKLEMRLDHRDIVVGGKKYRSFYTAGAFTEAQIDIKVDFGQGI